MTEIEKLTNSVNTLIEKFDMLINVFNNNSVIASTTPPLHEKSGMTLYNYLIEWLDIYKLGKIKKNTFKKYANQINSYIKDKIGNIKLNELTNDMIQKFIDSIELGRTRKAILGILKQAIEKAYKLNYITKNVCEDIDLIPYEEEVRRPLEKSEQRKIEKAIPTSHWGVAIKLYLTTGIRKGEIKRIKPDFSKKMLYVDGTKTKTSKRWVPLSDSMIADLKAFYASGRTFNVNVDNIYRSFMSMCKKLNIKNICIHSLRHTFATRCYESGIRIEIISQWLGHSDIETTKRYIHSLLEQQEKNAKLIGKVFD